MNKNHWLRRNRAAMAIARAATGGEARFVQHAGAERRSVRAPIAPFMLPKRGPATEGEREALRPPPASSRSLTVPVPPPFLRGHKPIARG